MRIEWCFLHRVAALIVIGAMLSSCVEATSNNPISAQHAVPTAVKTTSARPAAQTAVQKAIGKCTATVVGGAILGAILGGSDNRGRGAAIGAGVGAGACAVIMSFAAREDQERLAAAAREAVQENRDTTRVFITKEGKQATVSTRVEEAPVPTPKPGSVQPQVTNCRNASQQVSAGGAPTDIPQQLWCRTPEGNWHEVVI